jgi:hypothetical protein
MSGSPPRFAKSGLLQAGIEPSFGANRGLAVYDPKTAATKLIRTCFNTHHVVLGEDADNTVWVSSGGAAQEADATPSPIKLLAPPVRRLETHRRPPQARRGRFVKLAGRVAARSRRVEVVCRCPTSRRWYSTHSAPS